MSKELPDGGINGLPVAGYKPTQSQAAVETVNEGKRLQERALRYLDKLTKDETAPGGYDKRALAIARTHIETAFTFAARAVFQPEGVPRIELPEDRFSAPSARG